MEPRPPDIAETHIRTAEALLGVPLRPEGIEVPLEDDSIRRFACNAVLQRLRRIQGDYAHEEEELSEDIIQSFRSEPGLQRLAAQVQAANDTLVNWHSPPDMPADADTPESARGRFQSRALNAMVSHAQRAPGGSVHASDNAYREGLLTMAPPGAGKTALYALAANYAGVGLPVSQTDTRHRTGVGILNSRLLIHQGLDPSETLQRFANVGGRDMRIGAYFDSRHDGHDEYDMLLTTPRSYESGVLSGAIRRDTTVRYVLDEAHRVALAPSMQEHVTEFGSGLYMFTATPAIAGGRRDLRKQFPHSQFGTMREFIEDGILSPVQLFTYRAGPEAGSAANLAAGLAADYVRSGRKTLIVCQPGNELEQAREISKQINIRYRNGLIVPHERFDCDEDMIACTLGTFPGANTQRDIELLRQGRRLIATTVATGNEGLNIKDLDGLIIIGPQGAAWEIEQWLGRILRPSGQLAVAAEIFPHELRPGKPLASIFGPFGVEKGIITPGYYIGPSLTANEVKDSLASGPHLSAPGYMRNPRRGQDEDEDAGEFAKYEPPSELQDALVEGISVREATIAPADLAKLPPPEYARLDGIAPEGVPIEWLYAMVDKLDDPNIRYVGVWEPNTLGEMEFKRYYSPAAHAYFKEHPVPELVGDSEFLDSDIARLLGVSVRFVRATIERFDIRPLDRITKYHRNSSYYGMDTLHRVAAEVEKTPLAEESDVAVADLVKEISEDYVKNYIKNPKHNITSIYKRRNPVWGVIGSALHISAADADKIRQSYIALETADPEKYIGFGEIAKLAGVSLSSMTSRWKDVPQEKLPPTSWLRSSPKARGAPFVDRAWGEAYAEYVKPEKVLPWESTLAMVALYFGKKKLNMRNIIERRKDLPKPQRFPLPGVSETMIYPLSIIPDLRSLGMEPAADAPRFEPARAVMGPEDVENPMKLTYSQKFQRYYISPQQLPQTAAEVRYYAARREVRPVFPDLPQVSETKTPEPEVQQEHLPAPMEVQQEQAGAEEPDETASLTIEEVRARVDFTPEAFNYLMTHIDFYEGEATTNKDLEIIGFLEAGLHKVYEAARGISIPPHDWSSVKMVAHASGRTTRDVVMAAVEEIEVEQGQHFGSDHIRFCRKGSEVDVYFSPEARREIRYHIVSA